MLAISTWGLIMTSAWVGGLVLVLLVQAVWVWFRFRYAERSAAHARRLLDETSSPAVVKSDPQPAKVLAFRAKAEGAARSGHQPRALP